MITEIIIALIGLATTIGGGLWGWLMGKRKSKAEASLLEVDGLQAIREFYEKVQEDNNKKLDRYIRMSEANSVEIHTLKITMNKLINDACIKKGCRMRIPYNIEDIKRMYSIGDPLQEKEQETQ